MSLSGAIGKGAAPLTRHVVERQRQLFEVHPSRINCVNETERSCTSNMCIDLGEPNLVDSELNLLDISIPG